MELWRKNRRRYTGRCACLWTYISVGSGSATNARSNSRIMCNNARTHARTDFMMRDEITHTHAGAHIRCDSLRRARARDRVRIEFAACVEPFFVCVWLYLFVFSVCDPNSWEQKRRRRSQRFSSVDLMCIHVLCVCVLVACAIINNDDMCVPGCVLISVVKRQPDRDHLAPCPSRPVPSDLELAIDCRRN